MWPAHRRELTVAAHQIDCHIKVDGIVGSVTWSRLHPGSTTAECRDAGTRLTARR